MTENRRASDPMLIEMCSDVKHIVEDIKEIKKHNENQNLRIRDVESWQDKKGGTINLLMGFYILLVGGTVSGFLWMVRQ